jgi:hypothetical protein
MLFQQTRRYYEVTIIVLILQQLVWFRIMRFYPIADARRFTFRRVEHQERLEITCKYAH